MKKLFTLFTFGLASVSSFYFLLPSTALANTAYVPQTTLEYIAYLQGVVDALKAGSAEGASADVSVSTPSIASSVTLKSELETKSGTTAYAWFVYGQGNLNKKTSRTKVTKRRSEDSYEHEAVVKNLESGTYSYRAVFETRDGKKHYGSVNTFVVGRADGDYLPSNGGSVVNNSRGSITLFDTTVTVGEYIDVGWTVPERKAGSSNWIGLFTRSAKNNEYISWKNLSDDTSGTVKFYLKERGTYEFRLFYNNSYDDEVTSRSITVNRK